MTIIIGMLTATCLTLAAYSCTGLTPGKPDMQQTQASRWLIFVIVGGSAAYRQRIAMPPDAVLTDRVEEVSKADTPVPTRFEAVYLR